LNRAPPTRISPLSLHDALPISDRRTRTAYAIREGTDWLPALSFAAFDAEGVLTGTIQASPVALTDPAGRVYPLIMVGPVAILPEDRKSTRLNSSHVKISYAVFC